MAQDTATRDRLLEAAVEVFSERGYEGARVSEIARRAGLTTGAIYAQFRNKAELLLVAIERSSAQGFESLMLGGPRFLSAAELLTHMGRRLIEPDTPDWVEGLLVEALVSARRDPEVAEALRRVLREQGEDLASIFVLGKKEGAFDPAVDTAAAVRFATALSLGMLLLGSVGLPPPDRGAWEELIGRQVGALAKREET